MIISKGKLVASDTPDKLMELMKGEMVLELSVLGEEDKLKEILEGIEGIDSFELSAGKEEGEVNAQMHIALGNDIRKELFHCLATADMPIMQLRKDEKSLEDVFLELTGDNETATEDVKTEDEIVSTEGDNQEETTDNESDQEVTENDSDI
jgi:ABC-2 type transport system ATP-binding protein